MPIERICGPIETYEHTHDWRAVLKGERIWEELDGERTISRFAVTVTGYASYLQLEMVTPMPGNAINYKRYIFSSSTAAIAEELTSAGDDINGKDKPWFGKVRFISESSTIVLSPNPQAEARELVPA